MTDERKFGGGDQEGKKSRDYYEILGVSHEADEAQLIGAYRRLAMQFHPDRNPGDKAAEEEFKEINKAYEVLSDPEKRRNYDSSRRDSERTNEITVQAERRFLSELQGGPGGFGVYVAEARLLGIRPRRIKELIESEQAREVLKQNVISTIKKVPGYGDWLNYAKSWKTAGIDVSGYVRLPEVIEMLERHAMNTLKMMGGKDHSGFLSFVVPWERAGIRLRYAAQSAEARTYLTDQAMQIIRGGSFNDALSFLHLAQDWEGEGVELKHLVNSAEAQAILTRNAERQLAGARESGSAGPGKRFFRAFVGAWENAGWQPPPEIENEFNTT